MADHQRVERADARRAQIGRNDASSCIDRVTDARSGVVDERMSRRFDNDRKPLPHIERRETKGVCRRRRGAYEKNG